MKFTSDPAILGRPAGYLDCAAGLDSYPDKVFLRDRLYDHNHIVSLSVRYAIPNTPVSVGLSYTFSYTYWNPNESWGCRSRVTPSGTSWDSISKSFAKGPPDGGQRSLSVPVRRHGNLSTGEEIGESPEMATSRQLIRHDSERPSHLNLPVIPTYSPWTGSAADRHPLDIGWYAVAIPVHTRSSTVDRFPLQLVNRNTG
jgi:hypothetical protein